MRCAGYFHQPRRRIARTAPRTSIADGMYVNLAVGIVALDDGRSQHRGGQAVRRAETAGPLSPCPASPEGWTSSTTRSGGAVRSATKVASVTGQLCTA